MVESIIELVLLAIIATSAMALIWTGYNLILDSRNNRSWEDYGMIVCLILMGMILTAIAWYAFGPESAEEIAECACGCCEVIG